MVKVLLAVFLFSLCFSAQAEEFDCSDEGIKEFITKKAKFIGLSRSTDGVRKKNAARLAADRAMNACAESGYNDCKIISTLSPEKVSTLFDHYWGRVEVVGTKISDGAVRVVEIMCKQG